MLIYTRAEHGPQTPERLDYNFTTLAEVAETTKLLAEQGVQIAGIGVTEAGMSVTLSNGEVFGPFVLPTGIEPRGAWETDTAYVRRDLVVEGDAAYIALGPHVSGVFADDLLAGKWIKIVDGQAADAPVTIPPYSPEKAGLGQYRLGDIVHYEGRLLWYNGGIREVSPFPTQYVSSTFRGTGAGGALQVGDKALCISPSSLDVQTGKTWAHASALEFTGSGAVSMALHRIDADGVDTLILEAEYPGTGSAKFVAVAAHQLILQGDLLYIEVTGITGGMTVRDATATFIFSA